MKIKCMRCGSMQVNDERACLGCGARLGGFASEKGIFIGLGVMALVPIFLFSTSSANQASDLLDARIFFWYYMPIIAAFLVFYDYHPVRRSFYFYGAAIIAAASFFFLE
jgi:hypothetical protein